MSSRWDRLDIRRVTLMDQLMTEASKILWDQLGTWPPPFELERADATVPAADSPVPPTAAFVAGIRLARWDLQREFEAFDDWIRNRRWTEVGLDDRHKPSILFLASWLTESMLALQDATQGRAKRPDLVLALDRLQKKFEAVA